MKGKDITTGLLFILAGAGLLLNKLGYLGDINVFTLTISVILGVYSIKCLFRRDFSGFLIPLAIIGIMYSKQLGIEAITPWPLLGASILGSIGLSLIFGGKKKIGHSYRVIYDKDRREYSGGTESYNDENGNVEFEVTFSESVKYVTSNNFKNAHIKSRFGSITVYFDSTEMESEKSYIYTDVKFGDITIYLPKDWKAIVEPRVVFGDLLEKNKDRDVKEDKIVYIRGDVIFGNLSIIYI